MVNSLSKAQEIAEQVNKNAWLLLIQKVFVIILSPLLMIGMGWLVGAVMTLQSFATQANERYIAVSSRIERLEAEHMSLRGADARVFEQVTRLQTQREADVQVGQRLIELRTEVQQAIALLTSRQDQSERSINLRLDSLVGRRVSP